MRSPLEEELKEKLLAFAKSRDISQADLAAAGFDDAFFDTVAQHPISKVSEILTFLDARISVEVKGNTRKARKTQTFAIPQTPPARPLTWEDLHGVLGKYPAYKWAVAFQQHIDPKDNLAKYDRGEVPLGSTHWKGYRAFKWHTSACDEESAAAHRLVVCSVENVQYPTISHIAKQIPPILFPNQRLCDATPIAVYGHPEGKTIHRRMILMRNEKREWSPTGLPQEPYFRWLDLMLRPESLFGGWWGLPDTAPEAEPATQGG